MGSLVEVCLLHAELDGNVVADTKGGAVNEAAVRWVELCSLFDGGLQDVDKEIDSAITHPLYVIAKQSHTAFSLVVIWICLCFFEVYLFVFTFQVKLRAPQLPMLELLIPPNKNAQIIQSSLKMSQSVLRSIGG